MTVPDDEARQTDESWISGFLARERLPLSFRDDIDRHLHYLAKWLVQSCAAKKSFLLGINGAQGSGKTTVARFLQYALARRNLRAAVVSLDDFYLPKAARFQMAQDVHPLLETRGVPGTHDIPALEHCISGLASLGEHETLSWPVFDKASDDRSQRMQAITGPVDAIVFEGWCVGTPAEDDDRLQSPLNALEKNADADGRWRRYVNKHLRSDYAALFKRLDGLCYLRVPDLAAVRRWRGEQESKLWSQAGAGMSEKELDVFLMHFERVTRIAIRELPKLADCELWFDDAHRCVRHALSAVDV